MTPEELVELTYARELPAWTMLKVRDPVVGWRAFSAHEICILNEIFDGWDDPEIVEVGRTLGLIVEEDKND